MDTATVMSLIQAVLAVIQCSDQIKQFCTMFGYDSELERIQSTLKTIHAVLEDAEAKQDELSSQEKVYVEELKDAVYDADDVLDEFFTLIQQQQLPGYGEGSGRLRSLLSRFKPVAWELSRKAKKVMRKLDAIATKTNQFSFKLNHQPIKFRKEDSCSYVYSDDIIGRQGDVDNIVGMLVDSDVEQDVSFLSVVGIGGLGKTALAQLVYNDQRVTSVFPSRCWTCVADEDQDHLATEAVLRKILAAATDHKVDGSLSLDGVQSQLRERLVGKKYLLVLDDVWNENRLEWLELVEFFKGSAKGSWILVTTRSRETARIIGDRSPYELQGLSEDDSWHLFRKVAFEPNQTGTPSDELVNIGKEIVKKCASVPLAIKTIGSLLYGQPQERWLSFQENGLGSVSGSKHGIKPILKLSYHHLKSPLKSCFTYCALFPKDHKLYKEELVRLWMAQGYIMPEEGRDTLDVAEEYFLVLLRRCFFQEVKKDEEGNIESCKMHDLMHDIAQEVVGNEIRIASGDTLNVDGKVLHLGLLRSQFSDFSFKTARLRSYFRLDGPFPLTLKQFPLDVLLGNCVRLRTLDLRGISLKRLPESIGKLLHLRCLYLSYTDLEGLPEAVTKLHNLQTLDLKGCTELKELPKDMSKLVNLRVLDVYRCTGLTYMPRGLVKLTSLQTLGRFVVGCASGRRKQCVLGELEELKPLNNLTGRLEIIIGVLENDNYVERLRTAEGAYLREKRHLNDIHIQFIERKGYGSGGSGEYEEVLLEQLQPHPNLRTLCVEGYHGERMPRWLPHGEGLNSPSIYLPHLKELFLWNLPKLDYMLEEIDDSVSGGHAGSTGEVSPSSSFPSLVKLSMFNLPKLKGLWRRSTSKVKADNISHHLFPSSPFPLLNKVEIVKCPELEMTFISSCPLLESLIIDDLRKLENIHNNRLVELYICDDNEVESVGEKDLYQGSSFPNLRRLDIFKCKRLRSVKGWIEHFPALEELSISNCPNLVGNNEEEENDGIPWQHLPPTLHSLQLSGFNDMESLPEGVKYCTSLHSLTIYCFRKLKSVPTWMPNLTSLTTLKILFCTEELVERCKNPTGMDWPLIHHIPFLNIHI